MRDRMLRGAMAAFAVLFILKLAVPGLGAHAREQIAEVLTPGEEPAAAVRELGAWVSLRRETADLPSSEDARPASSEDRNVIWIPIPTPTPYIPKAEEAAETETPAAPTVTEVADVVSAFLETQAPFSDYALPDQVDYGYSALPFSYAVPVEGYNSSGFGYRLHPILNTVRFHYGTDFAAFSGERISAFADGTVSFAGYDDSYGYHVRIDHGDGWETHYAHCSAIYVSAGQRVQKGECIALVGASGLATGPHLHFELIHNGMYLNPEYYING